MGILTTTLRSLNYFAQNWNGMDHYIKSIEVRWADLDPNFHLRHSVYYDFGAYSRLNFFNDNGLTSEVLSEYKIGPIIFREEAVFRREIKLGDPVTIDLQLTRCRPDYSRWSIRHHIFKKRNELSAIITLDGAWINTVERKLSPAPPLGIEVFQAMPLGADFEWVNI